jgi:hypothetical protein
MNLKHFLDFKGEIGRIEISEPFGFDGSTHKVEQESFYGRDVVLGDEDIDLIIDRTHFEGFTSTQIQPDGTLTNYLNHAFDYLANEIKFKGWEVDIEVILEKDGLEFSKGIIDGLTAVVSKDQIKFKVIQASKREELKRRLETNINAFSDKDLDNNDIEPVQTIDMLMRAKPIDQISTWENKIDRVLFSSGNLIAPGFFNAIKQVNRFDIEDSVTWFEDSTVAPFPTFDYNFPPQNFKVIIAQTQLSQLKVKLKLHLKTEWNNGDLPANLQVFGYFAKGNSVTESFADFQNNINTNGIVFYNTGSLGPTTGVFEYEIDETIELDLPYTINQGEVLYFFFLHGAGNATQVSRNTFYDCELEIKATATAIDTVVKVCRLIDVYKHAYKSIGGGEVVCLRWDVGGEHYDNYLTTGYLLGQVTDKPFNNTVKSLHNIFMERNDGYQINREGTIEILNFDGFYNDNEIASFIEIPQLRDESSSDPECAVMQFEYNYKNSSKDRETNSEGSIDDIHGQSQWLTPSKRIEKIHKWEFDHIRSAFLLEEQRKRLFNKETTTALSEDTKAFLIKGTGIAPSRVSGFTASVTMQVQTTPFPALKILSTNVPWTLLGINIFSIVTITAGENQGTYAVNQIEPNVLTLTGTIFFTPDAPTFSGVSTITIEYTLSGVSLINETFEPFSIIEGVANPLNYGNLRYSIGRNLKDFYSLIGSFTRYLSGEIKNTLFEINGNLSTRLTTESENLADSEPIDIEAIKDLRKFEPRIETVNVFADFEMATDFFNKIESEKGYVRVNKFDGTVILGYPKEAEYKWSDNSLELKLRPKTESEYYDIDINLVNSFKVVNIFVSLYDSNEQLIVTPRPFDKMRLDGVVYTDLIEFEEALITSIE